MLQTFTFSHDGAFLPSSVGILLESDGMHNIAPMAQRHSPPYSSPSPMWLIVVSSTVVTRHCGRPQPSSSSSASSISLPPPSPLYCRVFLLLLRPFSIAVTIAATVSVFLLPPPYSVWLFCAVDRRCCLSSCCLPSQQFMCSNFANLFAVQMQ